MNLSGVSLTSQMVANYLVTEKWCVNFVVLREYNEAANRLDKKVNVIDFSGYKKEHKSLIILKSLWFLGRFILSNNSRPLMVWGKEYTLVSLILKMIFFRRNKIIGVNVNNIKHHLDRSTKISFVIKIFLYMLFTRYVDYWIAQSEGIQDEMVSEYKVSPKRVTVCYPAVELYKGGAVEPKEDEIVFVGRLTDQKNPLLALGYAIEFLRNHPSYIFRVLGDGDLMKEMKSIAKDSDLSDRIVFEGFVQNPNDFLKHAKVMILTSRYEGFGMVMIEAIASGVAVVSIDCPSGPSEIIQDDINGYLVKDRNIFAEKLSTAVIKKWNPTVMEQSISQFKPEKTLPQYGDILSKVVYK